jgi:SAM-dependent methyltransferase
MENKKDIVLSPITNSVNVKIIDKISSAQIIGLYHKEIKIDVSKSFKDIDYVYIYECLDSNYRFYYPFSCIGDDFFYETLSSTRKNYYSKRWEHSKALEYLKSNDNVLEVGSGFGIFMKEIQNKVQSVKGLELNPLAVLKCQDQGLNVENKLIQEESKLNNQYYDVVCFFQVLEHIPDVSSFLEASIKSLKEGGRVIIGVPNNNPFLFINDKLHTLNLPPHHAGLWNKKSLSSLQKNFPLRILNIEYEPLSKSYDSFLDFHRNKNPNTLYRKIFIMLNGFMPKILKKICCKFLNGRNIFIVFEKLS